MPTILIVNGYRIAFFSADLGVCRTLGSDKLLRQNRLRKEHGQQATTDLLSKICAHQTP
jgi:hypothetical protein